MLFENRRKGRVGQTGIQLDGLVPVRLGFGRVALLGVNGSAGVIAFPIEGLLLDELVEIGEGMVPIALNGVGYAAVPPRRPLLGG